MSNPDKIEVGDFVMVEFEHITSIFRGRVLYTPVATGDSWVIREELGSDRTLKYVQNFCQMTLLEKGKPE